MSSASITLCFCRSVLPSRFVPRQVLFLQPPKFALKNSRPVLFQSSFSRTFTNAKDAETEHKTESPIAEGSKIPEKKLVTTLFRDLIQKSATPKWKKIWIMILDNWKQVLGIGILADFFFALVVNKVSEYRVSLALGNGTRPKVKVLEDELVLRPQITATLKKIFQPNEHQSYYHVVCGEHGTGKTTLTRMAAKDVGQGVIYVDIPSDFDNLGEAFGRAINLSFFEDISFTAILMRKVFAGMGVTSGETVISLYQWRRVMKIFRRASAGYNAKHGKPPVIIYDNVSRLVNKNPEILDILQDDAKDNADDREYVAVFVSSEGKVPRRMECKYCLFFGALQELLLTD